MSQHDAQRSQSGAGGRAEAPAPLKRRLNRRGFLAAAGLAGVAGVLAACGRGGSAAPALSSGTVGPDLDGVNEAIRIQDDLFRHVNGSWLQGFEIPADKARFSTFNEIADATDERLRALVEALPQLAADADASDGAAKVRRVYDTYLDEAAIEQAGTAPIADTLKRIEQAADKPALAAVLGALQTEGINSPFGYGVQQDADDATQYILTFWQSGTSLPEREYYLDDSFASVRDGYTSFLSRLAELGQLADPAGVAATVLRLETALATAQWAPEKNRDAQATNNPQPLADLPQLAAGFEWERWYGPAGIDPALAERVNVGQPDFFTAAARLWADTSLADLKTYLTINVYQRYAGILPKAFADANFEFSGKVLSGRQEQLPRWKRAIAQVNSTVGEALGELYVKEHFPEESKAAAKELVDALIQAYRESFAGLEWMTEETKQAATAKLEKISVKIGYPDKWRDYSALTITTSAVENSRNASRFANQEELARLGQPVDRQRWEMTPQTVNAYYNPPVNEIVFPAAILQSPFFSAEAKSAVNFGGIGAVIGHEIGHAFDDQGSKYDGDGNLNEWWTEADRKAFEKKTAALIAQYDALVPDGINAHVNGELTVGENLADLGGLSISLRALKNHAQLDSFDSEAAREALLSWGRIWREAIRPEALEQQVASDPHSPGQFRANQVVRNVPAFYEAFALVDTDGLWLPPEERVTVW